VLAVKPARAGRLFALASVAIDIDGVLIEVHGIRALHIAPAGTRIELPTFRNAAGMPRPAITPARGSARPDRRYGARNADRAWPSEAPIWPRGVGMTLAFRTGLPHSAQANLLMHRGRRG
jgi:hypothetical protein